jgi:transposase
MGRPSIDPELMIRMLVAGYVFAIRSERLICREVQVNLAYRWFCKLGIEDAIPDHSAFSRARNERFRDGDIFRHMFERVVEACIAAGLVGGEGFAVDASLIQADANKRRKDRDPARSSRAVKEYLATLDDRAWGAASEVVPKFVSPSTDMSHVGIIAPLAPPFEPLTGCELPLTEALGFGVALRWTSTIRYFGRPDPWRAGGACSAGIRIETRPPCPESSASNVFASSRWPRTTGRVAAAHCCRVASWPCPISQVNSTTAF